MMTTRELDLAVDRIVFGRDVCDCEDPKLAFGHAEKCFGCGKGTGSRYTESILTAWRVLENMRERRFSIRDKFYFRVNDLINEDLGNDFRVHTAWNLHFLKPRHICLAAVEVLQYEPATEKPNPEEDLGPL